MMIYMAAYFLFVSSVHDFIEKQNVLFLFIGRATRQNALNSVYINQNKETIKHLSYFPLNLFFLHVNIYELVSRTLILNVPRHKVY